ncbi:three-Cys-motif partner protein TcmP [Helicobacter sp. T3_23-1059]
MAKDMHKEQWDSSTLTKLEVLEKYVDDWLNITLSFGKDNPLYETLEIYDLFCGSGFDGTQTQKGSPLRILDAILKRNRKGKTIKIYFNDSDKNKINDLEKFIAEKYQNLEAHKIQLNFSFDDVTTYRITSKNYYKLIFLDQYGIQHINKIDEFLCRGTDILFFISSGHCRRFLEDKSFQRYLDTELISKKDFENKPNYETHRIIAQYFKKKYTSSFIAPFSLIKDNENINGLIFISNHQKGQEQFLKTAWAIDKDFGEGNRNLDRDYTRDKNSLFYDNNELTKKEKIYKELLIEFLQEARTNMEIKTFGLDNGFLPKHTNKILKEIQDKIKCEYEGNTKSGFHLDDKEVKVKIRYVSQ